MRKSEIVDKISGATGIEKVVVKNVLDIFMKVVKNSLSKGENVYLRTFGTFKLVKRAKKVGRIIKKNKPIIIPEHYIPYFKPSKEFKKMVKNVKNKQKK